MPANFIFVSLENETAYQRNAGGKVRQQMFASSVVAILIFETEKLSPLTNSGRNYRNKR